MKDVHEKFEVYEENGVGEYWLVDPRWQTVLVYTLDDNGKYCGQLKPSTRLDKLRPITLPELVIDLEEVFEEVWVSVVVTYKIHFVDKG